MNKYEEQELKVQLDEFIFETYEQLQIYVKGNIEEFYDEDIEVFEQNIKNYVKEVYANTLEFVVEAEVYDKIRLGLKDTTNNFILSKVTRFAGLGIGVVRGALVLAAGSGMVSVAAVPAGMSVMTAAMAASGALSLGTLAVYLGVILFNSFRKEELRTIGSYDKYFQAFLLKLQSTSKKQKDFKDIYKNKNLGKVYLETLKICKENIHNHPKYTDEALKKIKSNEKEYNKLVQERNLAVSTCMVNSTLDFQLTNIFPIFIQKYKTLLVEEIKYTKEEVDPLDFDKLMGLPLSYDFKYIDDYKNDYVTVLRRTVNIIYKFNNKEVKRFFNRLNKLTSETKVKESEIFDFSNFFK